MPQRGPLPIHHAYADDERLQLAMMRGKYDANVHVFFGALYQAALVGALVGFPVMAGFEALASTSASNASTVGLVVGGLFGCPAAVLTYWGRWARVEAFCSRFCSGVANLSLLYVPLIALVYGNVVLAKDLFGARRSSS